MATYDYFEDGLLKQTDYGNGLKETRTYDAAGRLQTLSVDKVGQAVSRFEYGYDANGNRVSQVETRGLAGETTTYGYDEGDRLIGVEYPAETHLYQVDAVGNRTGEKRAATGVVAALTVAAFAALSPTVASAAVERQHNAVDWVVAVNDVKASTTTALTYDANGNRTGEGTKAYRWDIRDTLTRVEDGSTVVGTYDYDAKLQRVKADTAQGHVEYVLDGKYVLREGGARSRRYHFGEGEALAVTGVGGAAGQDRWLLTDALGSVVTEADATATSVTARQFDAWGNYRNNTAPTANETRLGYTGHQFDVETGLTYARARYYDSKLGVFLSRDPEDIFSRLAQPAELNAYAYASMNPLRYVDPEGRCSARPGEDSETCAKREILETRHFEQDPEKAADFPVTAHTSGNEAWGEESFDAVEWLRATAGKVLPKNLTQSEKAVVETKDGVKRISFALVNVGLGIIGTGPATAIGGRTAAKAGLEAGTAAALDVAFNAVDGYLAGAALESADQLSEADDWASALSSLDPAKIHEAGVEGAVGAAFGSVLAKFRPATQAATGGMKSAPLCEGLRQPKAPRPAGPPHLLSEELAIGRYRDVPQVPFDDLTPHHMPSADFMLQRAGIDPNNSLTINVQAPRIGGRHALTETFGRQPFLDESFRTALARDVRDLRRIYMADGAYSPEVRRALQDFIAESQQVFPQLFGR